MRRLARGYAASSHHWRSGLSDSRDRLKLIRLAGIELDVRNCDRLLLVTGSTVSLLTLTDLPFEHTHGLQSARQLREANRREALRRRGRSFVRLVYEFGWCQEDSVTI